jgi:hypothetical protein
MTCWKKTILFGLLWILVSLLMVTYLTTLNLGLTYFEWFMIGVFHLLSCISFSEYVRIYLRNFQK